MDSIYQSISGTYTDATVGHTIISLALSIGLVIMFVAIFGQAMLNWRKRADAKQFYLDNVIAFKVGYIHKTASEKGIDLKYRPKSDLMEKLEEEVSKDLHTSS